MKTHAPTPERPKPMAGDVNVGTLLVPIGVGARGVDVSLNLAEAGGVLIAGVPGIGKSALVRSMLSPLVCLPPWPPLKIIVIDTKGGREFTAFRQPGVVRCRGEAAETLLSFGMEDLRQRLEQHRKRGVVRLGPQRPRVLLVIDEYADLRLLSGCESEDAVIEQASAGAKVGIHFILVTQRPTRDVLTERLLAAIPNRVAFKTSSTAESRLIIGRPDAARLQPGQMLLHFADRPGLLRCRARRTWAAAERVPAGTLG